MNKKFPQKWLETQCSLIPGVHSAIFMVPDRKKNRMQAIAIWPVKLSNNDGFSEIVKYTLKKKTQICIPRAQTIATEEYDLYALPILVQSTLLGVIVVRIKHQSETKQEVVFNTLNQSVKWLRLANVRNAQEEAFYADVVGLLAGCFEQASYHEGLIQMVTELTRSLGCERVAFAEFHQHHCQIRALSNSANFDARSNLIQKIADAMDEAVEQDSAIVFPNTRNKLIQRAHQELARKFGSGSLCTIPLIHQQKVFGAITLLRSEEKPFDEKTLLLSQQALSLLTPFLVLKRDAEKNLLLKIASSLKQRTITVFGIRHLKLKLISVIVIAALILTSQIESEYRVAADAILEGRVQRVVSAPISGYLLSASARAGDTVTKGEIMASLNDSELQLELTQLNGELQKLKREYREAKSSRDLVKVSVISEQINQTSAEIDLCKQRLDNIRLKAPFDGIIIEGDLSQLLGSPVERGDTLFKIAPLDDYRIILKVDEHQIASVKQGQTGTLALTSLSQKTFPLTVETITAVAKADDGANIFRVEASLDNPPDLLRPGMQGVGKINAGQARLLWIWTHEIVDWIRLKVWGWWP